MRESFHRVLAVSRPLTHDHSIEMSYLIYGAYGYTGTLIAERAVELGHAPILAGRDATRLHRLAARLDLDARVAALDDPIQLREVVGEVPAVLHCAGPFSHTSGPMVGACLETGTHYLDISGEIPVLQALMSRGDQAEREGVLLLPGVGFDVVPTDCLARSLFEQVPSAATLEIAIAGTGGISQGTLKTAIEQMGMGGYARRAGQVVSVPAGWATRTVDFGTGPRSVISFPGGDVSTAGHSTDIPNVTMYVDLPQPLRGLLPLSRYVQGLLASPLLQALLKRAVERWVPNPSDEARAGGSTRAWVSVWSEEGERRTARLQGPHAYTFTARTAVQAADRVVQGPPAVGYQTPSTAFGASFVRQIEGVEWEEAPGRSDGQAAAL